MPRQPATGLKELEYEFLITERLMRPPIESCFIVMRRQET